MFIGLVSPRHRLIGLVAATGWMGVVSGVVGIEALWNTLK